MEQTKIIMGMPITVAVAGGDADIFDEVFSYFEYVDEKFSPFKEESELSLMNAGRLNSDDLSGDMRSVLELAERTKRETAGYFDVVNPKGAIDLSGLVKGWAIENAARLIKERGYNDFFVDAGGDVAVGGRNGRGEDWTIGIRNPFSKSGVVKSVKLRDGQGIATSGTYERGGHIWNPKDRTAAPLDIVSLTVIGPNVYEADRFATAACAMGRAGVRFIESQPDLEAYSIDRDGIATMTSGFKNYVA